MMPEVGDKIRIRRGRLKGSTGTIEVINVGAIGYREDGSGRLRWLSIERIIDLEKKVVEWEAGQ